MAGTVVHVPGGVTAIERIRVGDQVLSRHAVTGETAYRAVTEIMDVPAQDMVLVRFHRSGPDEDSMRIDTLAVTADQGFFVSVVADGNPGWRAAGDGLDTGYQIPLAQEPDCVLICADRLFATAKPDFGWSRNAWGVEQNDFSGYATDLRFHPPNVSWDESYNVGADDEPIAQYFQAPTIGIVVQEFHSLFVGTLGAWAQDASE